MRRVLKFLHTMGAVGFLGAMACLVVMLTVAPPTTSRAGYAAARAAMAAVSSYLLLPSLVLVLLAGLLAVGFNRAFHNAGWAWLKLVSGVLLFEGTLQNIHGPIRDEAERSAAALAGPAAAAGAANGERATLWVLLAVATANVVLGIWRPKLIRLPD